MVSYYDSADLVVSYVKTKEYDISDSFMAAAFNPYKTDT